jgi:putative intracellular protease/amidase
LFLGKNITCYPAYKENLKDCYNVLDDRVVKDGNLITSQAPGTAFEFAMKIVECLYHKEKADEIKEKLCVRF